MTVPIANYEIYEENETKELMGLDEQAIRHLDLTEVEGISLKKEQEGSLLHMLQSSCSSPFGKRLMRRWVVSPLCSARKIQERQKAVDDLITNVFLRQKLES